MTTSSQMPRWLADHLATVNGAPIGLRNAKPRRCKCGATVLHGLDADVLALEVDVDPVALNADGELSAIGASRRTYDLHLVNGRLRIEDRDRWRKAGRPARIGAQFDVVPEHWCNYLPPPEQLTQPSNLA